MDKPEEKISTKHLKAVALQLQKDFMMFNTNFLIESISSRHELVMLLANECHQLLEENPKKLTQIIYRIDLYEESVSSALSIESHKDKASKLGNLMLSRTLQKVKLKELLNTPEDKNKKLPD